MKVSEFNYELPEELIAQVPIKNRDESRLMVLDKNEKTIEDKVFKDILDYLQPGDCLVRNNTKVIPARLYGIKEETNVNVEFLLLKRIEGDTWEVMVHPGRRLKPGTRVVFGNGLLRAEILEILDGGNRKVRFEYEGIFNEILDQIGLMPLPPYIHESLKQKDRYQTVYAKHDGSAAAPTAAPTPKLTPIALVKSIPSLFDEGLVLLSLMFGVISITGLSSITGSSTTFSNIGRHPKSNPLVLISFSYIKLGE